jgi:ubiquinol-cytochrome c reductase cytochrome c1 subunit
MQTIITRSAAALVLALSLGGASHAQEAAAPAATPHFPLEEPKHVAWSFAGPFGKFDPQQLQRGFQVYKEVCSGCHALSMVAFRNLSDPGGPRFSKEEVQALAATYDITDGPNDAGEMFQRKGRPSDYFPGPFPNEKAARANNNGAYPPDMSLLAKARAVERGFPTFLFDIFTLYQEGGPDYIFSLVTGYQDPPAGVQVPDGQYYNPHFISGPALAMPPPLTDGQVKYSQNKDEDKSNDVPETVDQYAKDVSAFLMWAAEPHMAARKQAGLAVIVFLIILAGLVYYTKKKVWSSVPGERAA